MNNCKYAWPILCLCQAVLLSGCIAALWQEERFARCHWPANPPNLRLFYSECCWRSCVFDCLLRRGQPMPVNELSALKHRHNHQLPVVWWVNASKLTAMIVRIKTDCTCWRRDNRLVIPVERLSSKPVIRLCRRSRAAIRRRGRGCRIGLGDRMSMGSTTSAMEGARPGPKSVPGAFPSLFPPLPPVGLPQHATTRFPHFFTIPCNLSRRFPLYGVEAGNLPAKAAQRKEVSVDKDLELVYETRQEKTVNSI